MASDDLEDYDFSSYSGQLKWAQDKISSLETRLEEAERVINYYNSPFLVISRCDETGRNIDIQDDGKRAREYWSKYRGE